MKRLLALVCLLMTISGCGISQMQPIRGYVREAGTGRPIPDAVVAATWQFYEWHTHCLHVRTATTDSNGEYVIPVQWRDVVFSLRANIELGAVVAYKAGYRNIWEAGFLTDMGQAFVIYGGPPDPKITTATLESLGFKTEPYRVPYYPEAARDVFRSPLPSWLQPGNFNIYVVPDVSTPDVRLAYLQKIGARSDCYGAGHRNRNLTPLFEAMYEEAHRYSSMSEVQERVSAICRELAYVATRKDGHPTVSETDALITAHLKNLHPECLAYRTGPREITLPPKIVKGELSISAPSPVPPGNLGARGQSGTLNDR